MIGTRGIVGVCIVIGASLLACTMPSHLVCGSDLERSEQAPEELDENIDQFFGDDSSDAELFNRSGHGSGGSSRQSLTPCGLAPLNPLSRHYNTSSRSSMTPYILGGSNQRIGEWPSFVLIVAINDDNNRVKCSGVILSEFRVLTAAHCVAGNGKLFSNILIHTGVNSFLNRGPMHKRYDAQVACLGVPGTPEEKKYKDWALLKPTPEIELNEYTQTACMPSGEQNEEMYFRLCTFLGAGAVGYNPGHHPQQAAIMQMIPVNRVRCTRTNSDRIGLACYQPYRPSSVGLGDAGGPVMCLNAATNLWTAVAMATDDGDNYPDGFGIFALMTTMQAQWESVSCIIP